MLRGYVSEYRACGDSLPFNPHKISIFKDFMVSEMSDCHPFATLILKKHH